VLHAFCIPLGNGYIAINEALNEEEVVVAHRNGGRRNSAFLSCWSSFLTPDQEIKLTGVKK